MSPAPDTAGIPRNKPLSYPNLIYSPKRERQVSTFESRVDSLVRRLSNPFFHRRNLETACRGIVSAPLHLETSTGMPPTTEYGNGEWEEFHTKKSKRSNGKSRDSDAVVPPGERAHGSQGGPGVDAGKPAEHGSTQGVDPYVQEVKGVVKALHNLCGRYSERAKAIEEHPMLQVSLLQLREEAQDKDNMIESLHHTIDTLERRQLKAGERLEIEKTAVAAERKIVEEEKESQRKRAVKLEKEYVNKDAEQKLAMDERFRKYKSKIENDFKVREDEREKERSTWKEDQRKKMVRIEKENTKLLMQLDEQKQKIEEREMSVKELREKAEESEMVKATLRQEKKQFEAKLKATENEFCMSGETPEFLQKHFQAICGDIEILCLKHFGELSQDDADEIHRKLSAMDKYFVAVPFSNTKDACKLRSAHAYRVISGILCAEIWKPFSCEQTTSNPACHLLLDQIGAKLAAAHAQGHSERAATIWSTLTMRGLLSLESTEASAAVTYSSKRAKDVTNKILAILAPLADATRIPDLSKELLDLVNSTLSTWTMAQLGTTKLRVFPSLDIGNYEAWRSPQFDPIDDGSSNSLLTISGSAPPLEIFTLFPRIVAEVLSDDNHDGNFRVAQTEIHPGLGLPEWSTLVVAGKEENEESQNFVKQAIEKAEKDAKRELSTRSWTGKIGGISRRNSMVGVQTVQRQSPSEQWKTNGGVKIIEESGFVGGFS